jgi:hypothetical protein
MKVPVAGHVSPKVTSQIDLYRPRFLKEIQGDVGSKSPFPKIRGVKINHISIKIIKCHSVSHLALPTMA